MDSLETYKFDISSYGKRNDVLKLIAMITMLIDHIGLLFFPSLMIFRTIGRIAFPIFAYQLSLGYSKTNNLEAYMKRLLIFSIISQIPYVFLNRNMDLNLFHFNVIFLFLYGIIALILYDKCSYSFYEYKSNKTISKFIKYIFACFLLIIIVFLPMILEIIFTQFAFSYSTYGIIMILLFHIFRNKPVRLIILYILFSFFTTYLKVGYYLVNNYQDPFLRIQSYFNIILGKYNTIKHNMFTWKGGIKSLSGYFFQLRSLAGVLLIILLENVNTKFTLNKYVSYWFYPLHISLLLSIKTLTS